MRRSTIKLKMRGLGDAIAAIAKPIARVIDAIAGTDIEHCSGCARRQDALNRVLPLPTGKKGWQSVPPAPPSGDTPANPR